jgi:hypothetical protein
MPENANILTRRRIEMEPSDQKDPKSVRFWTPTCRTHGRPCGGASFALGEACTWCGLKEDGSYD